VEQEHVSEFHETSVIFQARLKDNTIIGYCAITPVVDEIEILDIAINQESKRQSFSNFLLADILK
jgi:N-acetylglutamate synthase-like GNAT family acetyltransferase